MLPDTKNSRQAYAYFKEKAQHDAAIDEMLQEGRMKKNSVKELELMVAKALVDHAYVDTQRYLASKQRFVGHEDELFPGFFVGDVLRRIGWQARFAFPDDVQAYEHGFGSYGFSLYRFESPKTYTDYVSVMLRLDKMTNEMIVAKALTPPKEIPTQGEVIARFGHKDHMLYANNGHTPDEPTDVDEQVRRIVNYIAPALPGRGAKRQFLEGVLARREALKLAC